MDWWRAYHGLPVDPKLGVVAKRAECPRHTALALWVYLLDRASRAETRGQVGDLDPEVIGEALDLPQDEVERLIAAFLDKGMLTEDGRISAWEKHQPTDSTSAERMRRYRERQNVTPVTRNVTASDGVTRNVTASDVEEKRLEEKRESQNLCAADAAPESAQPALLELLSPKERTYGKAWYDEQHERWYQSYWRHVDKADSRKAYEKRIKALAAKGMGHENAAELLYDQAAADRARFEPTQDWDWRLKLHPATWLNGERWLDEPTKSRDSPVAFKSRQQENADAWERA